MQQDVVYGFGTFRLDPARRILDSAGESVGIPPKALDALVFLVEHRDRVVKKEELIDVLWPDVAVQDSSLTQLIFVLRKALDRNTEGREYIATASRHGYRFVAPVTVIAADGAQASNAVPRSRTARLAPALGVALIVAFTLTAAFAYASARRPLSINPHDHPPAGEHVTECAGRYREPAKHLARRPPGCVRRARWMVARFCGAAACHADCEALPAPKTRRRGRCSGLLTASRWRSWFGHLKRIDVDAGTVQDIADGAYSWRGSWSAQGTILFLRKGGLHRVPASGGTPAPVASTGSEDEFFSEVNFLPDGRHFVVLMKHQTSSLNELRVGGLDSADTHVLLSGSDLSEAQYAAPFLLFMRGGGLQAQRLDLATFELVGEPISVAEQVSHNDDGYGAMSVSDTGVLAYRTGGPPRTQLIWVDRTGRALGRVDTPDGHVFSYHLSPDGRQVTAVIGPRTAEELWLLNSSGGPPRRLPFPAGHVGEAVWSRDGSSIAFLLDDGSSGGAALMRQMVNLSAAPEELLRSPHFNGVTDWSSDGRFFIVQMDDTKLVSHLWAVPMSGDRHPVRLTDSGEWDTMGQLSPDGEWLAYRSRHTGRDEVYVKHFVGDAPPWKVSASGGSSPRWRGDGKELFYLQNDRSLMAVGVDPTGTELRARQAERLFDVHFRQCSCFNFAASPDGQRFLVNTFPNSGESQPLVVVLNWAADLEAPRTDHSGRR